MLKRDDKLRANNNLLAYSSTSGPEQQEAPAADNDLRNDLWLRKRSNIQSHGRTQGTWKRVGSLTELAAAGNCVKLSS
ncbi:unnamed protein product [Dovyalis caffra]|uniref:Uncharacterized protein n=1 Tax=Dovyalis caffra TaxID=77055 RepID=A0AAV1QYW5_9ROSI|nr:unnamed protein product [Dovyalis caffra]